MPRLDPPTRRTYPVRVAWQPLDESTSRDARRATTGSGDVLRAGNDRTLPRSRHSLIKLHATRRGSAARSIAAVILGGSVALLVVAAWLDPDPRGVGTHRQLGMPSCTAVTLTGYPCPTCGMTTAFAYTVRGRLGAAFFAQPAGLALALVTMVAAVASAVTVTTGLIPRVNWYVVNPTWVVLAATAVILGGWVFKLATGRFAGTLPAG